MEINPNNPKHRQLIDNFKNKAYSVMGDDATEIINDIETYEKAGRVDLLEKEKEELKIWKEFDELFS